MHYALPSRATGGAHLATDLEERLATLAATNGVSWHASDQSWPPGRYEALAALFGQDLD